MSEAIFFSTVPSPVGALTLVADADAALIGLYFDSDPIGALRREQGVRDDRRLQPAARQLDEYFAGRRTRFDLALAPRGTPFQKAVWAALVAIPFGQTASYGDIAQAIGQPAAVRAIGGANHRNPLAIVVPCHRVIGADGSLTGYGGGLDRKRLLLALEARVAATTPASVPAARRQQLSLAKVLNR
ncbi:MAG TPA: methylated-DNA--[protein]-cysteine S-methyltransferase [Polyangia bacterium]|jgi:methylated-DNA-[protein]-cysteine S-methyltransferase